MSAEPVRAVPAQAEPVKGVVALGELLDSRR
jgi:hypothetical protein